jgi:methionine-rich copper-binding protein CopC
MLEREAEIRQLTMHRIAIVALQLSILLGATAAQAHAHLDRAEPRVGSTVPSAPREVTLWFSQNIEPAFSSAEVTDANGIRFDQGKAQIEGNVMRLGVRPLPPGSYRVHWKVLSVDTHTTEGTFPFRVGQ